MNIRTILNFRQKAICICLWCLIYGLSAHAQSNIRFKNFTTKSDTILLDSLSLVPNTIAVRTVSNDVLDSSFYVLKSFESKLIWKKKPAGDSVKIFFRVYPFALARETHNKDYQKYLDASANAFIQPFVYNPDEVGTKLIDFGSLDYNGSFARSIAFGSNQDVVLNSLFNLQLSGKVTKDLEITAAITDNNIPVQPEGNTQQLQEFDKIYIQLQQWGHKVIVGDFDLFNPDKAYFLKFSKKYQGGYYSGSFNLKKIGVFKANAAGGISKGKFARNTLPVSEGNQGPYKLLGANNETFIVVLANTEAVFINGQKMERGANRDYVIDYNLGEVTFMPRRIITKDLRVTVEFEYSDRNYLRSAAFLNTELNTKRADVHFNLYSEQDSKGQNIQQSLTAEKKTFLTTIGDSIQNSLYDGFDSVAYDANRILYRLVPDSLGQGRVFVYSTDSTKAKYAVNFTFAGVGAGDYIAAASTANGRVYEWLAPYADTTTGNKIHQGSYIAKVFLVTPKYQQMYSLGTDLRLDKNNTLSAEVAMSNTDLNMFSTKDDKDNLGFAVRASYKGTVLTEVDSLKNKQNFNYNFDYEFLQNQFNTIERYRNVEFNRDWNLQGQEKRYNEHLASANLGYVWSNAGNINYRFKTFIQDSIYKGFENAVNGNFFKKGFNVVFANSYLNSASARNNSNYFRPKADFSYTSTKTKGWIVGALYDHEINMLKNKNADSLSASSYLWQNYKVYVSNADSSKNKFGVEFLMRYEHHAKGNGFDKEHFSGQTANILGQINSWKNQTLNYTFTYRHAKERDTLNTTQPEHFYLGRIDYNFVVLKGVFRSTTLYEIGSGRQQKTEIIYQRSPTNQGDYVWGKDLDGDGVKDINEFKPKQEGDTGTYVRVYISTPEYISVNTTQFNEVLNINPAAVWHSKGGIRGAIAKFSLFASISLSKKTFADGRKRVGEYFNPFPLIKQDSFLVSTAISSRNTLFFNRLEPKYGAQFDLNYSRNRTLLTSGYENRTTQSQGVSVRWNIFKSFNSVVGYVNGMKSNESDFYNNFKYRFTYNDASVDFSYQFKTSLRIGLRYDLSYKENPTDTVGKQTAQQHKLTLMGRYNREGKSAVEANLSYAAIKYNDKGYKNEQLEYAMLEGLRNGNNLVWSLSYSQTLLTNIQLTIGYDGRMTGFTAGDKSTIKPIHTGRAEVRAVF